MRSHELKAAKRRIRGAMRSAREAIAPDDREAQTASATANLVSMPEVAQARVVMAFWSFGSEISTHGLLARLEASGKTVVLPSIHDGEIEPRTYRAGDPLEETSFGAMEPSLGEPVAPGAIDVVIVPAVAFDRVGRRIGYGGGFYDRFLATTPAFRVGFAFDEQLVDEDLPAGDFDLKVSAVVTASGAHRC
jgi:5-formyltetrahydrofolate cyclo-ligase